MIHRMVAVLTFFGLLMTGITLAIYIVQPAKAQTPSTGPGSPAQSGTDLGGVDHHLFCNTGVMTPICK